MTWKIRRKRRRKGEIHIAAIKPDETKRKLNRKKKAEKEKERKSFEKIFQRRIFRGKWIQSNATTRHTACVQPREESRIDNNRNKIKKDIEKEKKQTIWTCVCIYRRDLLYVLYRSIYTDSRSDYLNLPKRRDNSQSVTDTRLLCYIVEMYNPAHCVYVVTLYILDFASWMCVC